jgi:gamma-butyrobetaine dioxygenase
MLSRVFSRSVRFLCSSKRLFAIYPSHERIVSVQLHDKEMTIGWSCNKTARLPYLYLRDSCKELAFDVKSRQRVTNPAFSLDFSIKPIHADANEDGQLLCITWPGGEKSQFSSFWLKEHSEGVANITSRLCSEQKLWKGDYFDSIPRFDFEGLMQDNRSLLDFLLGLDTGGLILIENVGTTSNQVVRFAERISYAKTNCYGKDVMKAEIRSGGTHLVYTDKALELHTDLPYYSYSPGVGMLHSIQQPSGTAGSSYFCDGFNVAKALRLRNPAAFEMLSQYPVEFCVTGKDYLDYNLKYWRTPISLDESGEITAVYFSNFARGSKYHSSLNGKLLEWYEAFYAFSHLMFSPEFVIQFKIEPGQMAVFDNTRVLHGRPDFKLEADACRCLETVYLDWDEMRSKARVIMEEMSEKADK